MSAGRSAESRTPAAIAVTNVSSSTPSCGHAACARASAASSAGPAHPEVGQSLNNMADTLFELGRYPEALAAFERALDIKTRALGTHHVRLAPSLVGIGQARVEMHEPAQAIPLLEQGCALLADGDPTNLATCRFWLARALWDANRDRRRARALAAEGRTAFAGAGETSRTDLERVDAWLALHK